jgi:lipopolysaccharide heptosyltransferase II
MKNRYTGFLVIHPAFIGDVILATSVVESLKAKFPDEPIDFFVRKGNEKILENNPHIRKLYVWDKGKNKFANLLELIKEVRQNRYLAVINLHRFFNSGLLTAFAKSKYKAGFRQNPFSIVYTHKVKFEFKTGLHEIERYHRVISFLDVPLKLPRMYPSDRDFSKVEKLKVNKYVCIAPASVWFTKQLPPEKWIELIDNYLPTDVSVYLLGAKQDRGLCVSIMEKCKTRNRIKVLAGELSLTESAALMKDAVMNYTNDSAPLHICSAMNAPVTAVFCSTVPEFGFTPLSDNSKIVETTEKLDCRPCGIHGKKECPEGHFKCGYSIDVAQMKIDRD